MRCTTGTTCIRCYTTCTAPVPQKGRKGQKIIKRPSFLRFSAGFREVNRSDFHGPKVCRPCETPRPACRWSPTPSTMLSCGASHVLRPRKVSKSLKKHGLSPPEQLKQQAIGAVWGRNHDDLMGFQGLHAPLRHGYRHVGQRGET